MNNSNSTHVCAFCSRTGGDWVLTVGKDAYRVHKGCAYKLAAHAPEGVTSKVTPSDDLRRKWRAEAREREARAFWAEKFKAAQNARMGTV